MIISRTPILAALLVLSVSFPAIAAPLKGYETSLEDLLQERGKLASLPVKACPANYAKLSGSEPLRIGFFFGYENFGDEVIDRAEAKALEKVLSMPCGKNLGACGFKPVSRGTNEAHLERILDGRKIQLAIHSSSVADTAVENGADSGARQRAQSLATRAAFHRAISDSDIVFYVGHARVGGGLGFYRNDKIKDAFNIVFHTRLEKTLRTLQSSKRLKVLGLFACETEKYYRREVERANPRVDLILSQAAISEASTMALGSLNAILLQQCDRERDESLVAAKDPRDYADAESDEHDHMIYLRR